MAEQEKKDELDQILNLDSSSNSESEHKLEDIDPLFAKGEEKQSEKGTETEIKGKPNSNVPIAGAIGAATGAVLGKLQPELQTYEQKSLNRAKENAAVAEKSVQRQVQKAAEVKAQHVSNVDTVHNELKAAQARFDAAQEKLGTARQNAIRLNAIIEPLPPAAPTVGSTVPIDEGAMRHNVKMGNIVDYNAVRKGMTGTTAETSGMGRLSGGYTQSGRLIVPSELANAPLYNAEQLAAQKTLSEAETALKSAQTNLNQLQAKWKGMAGSTPKSVQTADIRLATASEKAAQAADRLREIESLKPSGLQRAGAALSRIPFLNVLGGALTGAEAMHAYEQGMTPEGITAGLGAAGGALMMTPYLPAKALGAALSMPPLVYQGYKYYQENKGQAPKDWLERATFQ